MKHETFSRFSRCHFSTRILVPYRETRNLCVQLHVLQLNDCSRYGVNLLFPFLNLMCDIFFEVDIICTYSYENNTLLILMSKLQKSKLVLWELRNVNLFSLTDFLFPEKLTNLFRQRSEIQKKIRVKVSRIFSFTWIRRDSRKRKKVSRKNENLFCVSRKKVSIRNQIYEKKFHVSCFA